MKGIDARAQINHAELLLLLSPESKQLDSAAHLTPGMSTPRSLARAPGQLSSRRSPGCRRAEISLPAQFLLSVYTPSARQRKWDAAGCCTAKPGPGAQCRG